MGFTNGIFGLYEMPSFTTVSKKTDRENGSERARDRVRERKKEREEGREERLRD